MATKSDQNDTLVFSLEDGSEVTLGELKSGYMKNTDYIQKSAAVWREIVQLRGIYRKAMARLRVQQRDFVKFTKELIPEKPDEELVESNPSEYHEQNDLRNRAIAEIRQFMVQAQQTRQLDKETDRKHMKQVREIEEFMLLSEMPHLIDSAQRAEFNNNILNVMTKLGYREYDVKMIYDHRFLMLAYYAYLGKLAEKTPVAQDAESECAEIH